MSTTVPTTTGGISPEEDEKCVKIKRFIGIGVLIALAIIGWHLYGKLCCLKIIAEMF